MYRSRYKTAVFFEGFGISPIMSANIEVAPIRFRKSFYSARAGVGYLPAGRNAGKGFTLPVGVSYNFLLKNLRKSKLNRVMNKCKMLPPKFAVENFFEVSPSYTFLYYPNNKNARHNVSATIGFKSQFYLAIPPKTRVAFIRLALTPTLTENKLLLIEKKDPNLVGNLNPGNSIFSNIQNYFKQYRFYGGFVVGFSI